MRTLSWLLAVGLLSGCTYARDRLLDLTDVVDLTYGTGEDGNPVWGIGLKARATEVIGTCQAWTFADTSYDNVEWYGRRKLTPPFSQPWSVLLLGGDRQFDGETGEFYILLLRAAEPWPQPASFFRFGGEIILPMVRGGAFLNVGELLDFLLGFTTIDIANDDGLAPGAPIDSTPESHPIGGTEDEEQALGPIWHAAERAREPGATTLRPAVAP